jgi:hypothetical protein
MRRAVKLIVVGLVAFGLSLLVFLPASLLVRWLPPNVTAGVLSGTVWNGASDSLQVNGEPLGAARWKVRPLALLRGKLAIDARLARAAGEATGRVFLQRGGAIRIEDVQARWPLAGLPARVAPRNWSGDIQVQLQEIEFENDAVRRIVGTVEARDLVAAPRNVGIGSYRVSFDPQPATDTASIVGQLQDLGGPMEVAGTVTLQQGGCTIVSGRVKARPGAPVEITRELEYLRYQGEPDAQGRLPFSLANNC